MSMYLDLIESNNIHGLNKILESGDLIFQIVHHNFIVFNNAGDLQFFDTITRMIVLDVSLWEHWSFGSMTYPTGTNLPVPQRRPSIVILLILFSIASRSVSSSHGLISRIMLDLAITLPFLASFASLRALYSAIR